jgi:hypothetical protein
LRVAAFRDDDTDARKSDDEQGVAGLAVHVEGNGWSGIFIADEAGVAEIVVPAEGEYTIRLADGPGADWKATTSLTLTVRLESDGTVVIVSTGEEGLPVGTAEGAAFAFGLVMVEPARRVTLWLALAGAALLAVAAVATVVNRRSAAIRRLERTIQGGMER